MRYGLLGSLDVRTDDGVPVAIPAAKRRALLAILLLQRGSPARRDDLIDGLWGSDPPPAAEESLFAHVSRLRRELGADEVRTVSGGYQLPLGPDDLDVIVFERRLRSGRRAVMERRWEFASRELRAALDLWRGPALLDVAEEAFAAPEVARLDELRVTALEDWFEAELALGHHVEIVGEIEAVVATEPLRERLWGQLMLALYRAGRQADALAAYRKLRRSLVEQLGIDPGVELQDLQRRILRHDPTLDLAPEAVVPEGVVLPRPATPLVGRRAELELAVAALRDAPLVTLTGPGGVGKTRLGLAVAEALLPDHPDGTVFVDLSPVTDAAAVAERIGESVGGGARPGDVIARRRMLLLLDNFEQVLDGAPAVAALLAACPNLRIVVTSRAPLHIGAERVVAVPPLDPDDAASLFVGRARAALANAVLAPDLVDDVVARLDGIPLAIELAAARVPALSLQAIREHLANQLDLLAGERRDSPKRHRAIRETIAWSYDLLEPATRAVFRKLSVLAAGFDLDAALEVGEATIESVGALVDHSLLRRDGGRYSMLETIKAFAVEAATASGETDDARTRLVRHFAPRPLAARRREGREAGRGVDWLDECTRDRDNLRLAFDWAVAAGDTESIVQLFRGAGTYWLLIGAVEEGRRWAAAALAVADERSADEQISIRMIASELARYGGDLPAAIAIKSGLLEQVRSMGDDHEASVILDDLAWTHAALDDYEAAWAAIDAARTVHDGELECPPNHLAHTLATSAEILLREGRLEDAERAYEAYAGAETAVPDMVDWNVEGNLIRANVLLGRGDLPEAARTFETVVQATATTEFRGFLADALDGLAAVRSRAEPAVAARLIGSADRLRAETGSLVWLPRQRRETLERVGAALDARTCEQLRDEGSRMPLSSIAASASSSLAGGPDSGSPVL
jgi:predicted ATPase/DNA-binding SARP family transcriptional activator